LDVSAINKTERLTAAAAATAAATAALRLEPKFPYVGISFDPQFFNIKPVPIPPKKPAAAQ
jgi:hypothetical protein